MNNALLSTHEQLIDLQLRLPELQRKADAELNLVAAGVKPGHIAGACEARDAALSKIHDLERAEAGLQLHAAMTELQQLDEELTKAQTAREAADKRVAEASRTDVITRWQNAPHIARIRGVGYGWELFVQWYLTGKDRVFGLTEMGSWFLDAHDCPAPLRFNLEGDRKAVRGYVELKHDAEVAAMALAALADRRARLLAQRPELAVS